MKKQLVNKTLASMLVSMLLLATSVYAENPSPAGYTIFGPNKYGYTDLTGKVQYSTNATVSGETINGGDYASVPTAASSTISFTGTGHYSHYCQSATAISIRFSESVTMTLTDKYAVHMKIKRTNAGTGDIQSSFIKGTWGSVRVGFLWTGIIDTEQEIVLKYSDRTQNSGGQYYCNRETDTYGTQTFAGGNWNELFRMTALSGESFEISQIYIKADETQDDPVDPSGDKDAPTNLQATVKSVADVSAVITASAEDENAITFNVYNGENVIATATSTSGVAKDIEITGLTPETAYSLDVEAVDAAGNTNPNRVNVQFITTEQFEKRYYFVRSGDLPVIEKMTAVDLRANNSSIAAWSNRTPTLGDSYASWTLPNTWFAADLEPKAQCMSDVTKADWYLRIKFKTDAKALSGNNLRFNLNNNAGNFFTDNSYGDGEWHDTVYVLANAAGTLRSFPVKANEVMFQLHANGDLKGSYFYIEYAYLTNMPTNPEQNPQVNPQGLGLYQVCNMKMYNPLNDLPNIDGGMKDRLNLYVVSLGNDVCFKQVTKTNNFDSDFADKYQICRLNSEGTSKTQCANRTSVRTESTVKGDCPNFLSDCTDDPIKMTAYAKMFGGDGYYSEIFDFRRGYNNTPSTDRVAPTFSASGKYNTQTQKVTLTFSDPSEEVFYYIVDKATNTPRITISDSIELDYNQGIPDFDVNAVDFNGNFSETITVAPECGTCFPVTF